MHLPQENQFHRTMEVSNGEAKQNTAENSLKATDMYLIYFCKATTHQNCKKESKGPPAMRFASRDDRFDNKQHVQAEWAIQTYP